MIDFDTAVNTVRELFDKVQETLMVYTERSEHKEFAFTKLMTCGLCGSGITADEKFKKQKDGTTHIGYFEIVIKDIGEVG